MNRRHLMIAVAALAAGAAIWSAFGGCRPDTRIASRTTMQSGATRPIGAAEDWPKLRGPRGDGISQETIAISNWPADGPPRLWSANVGLGFSSPVAAASRVYLFTLSDGKEALTAFDAATGAIVWNVFDDHGWTGSYEGTRATPTIDDDRIYTLGGGGDLICRRLADGGEIWRQNVLQLASASNLQWGAASSPLVEGSRVHVQCGVGGPVAMAFDKLSGNIAWKSEAVGSASYAPPLLIDVEGLPQLIVFGGDTLYAMNPADGRAIWSHPWATNYGVNGSAPVYRDGHLFITSSYGKGCAMFQATATGASKLWENKNITSRFQPTILDGDTLYANSEGTLVAMSWPDGAVRWRSRDLKLGVGGSLVRTGDKLILMSERGTLAAGRATPTGFELLARADVFDAPQVWSTPLLYGGRIYAKGENEFVCFDLGGGSTKSAATQPLASGKGQ